jgi:hypothetical protein
MSIQGLLFQWASTIKSNQACWSSTTWALSSSHWKLTCSPYDITEKSLSWHKTTITHLFLEEDMFLVGFVLYIRSLVSYVCFVGHCLSFYLLNLLNSGFQNWLLLVPLLRTLQLCQFLLCFYFRPLCCLFFFDLRILITPMLSSNSSS